MMPNRSILSRRGFSGSRRIRAGLSFTEVMFAVMILGVGFIMLAGMFPVAIQQTRLTTEDTEASTMARSALQFMEQMSGLQDANVPPRSLMMPTFLVTTQVIPISPTITVNQNNALLSTAISGNLIRADDARYAWVPLYRREPNSPYAQIYLFAVRNRNRDVYTPSLDALRLYPPPPPAPSPNETDPAKRQPATLEARSVSANLYYRGDVILGPVLADVDMIEFLYPNPATPDYGAVPAAGPGGYVVVGNTTAASLGKIYRVGNRRTDKDQLASGQPRGQMYELSPGYDMATNAEHATGATVYIVGRGYVNPATPASGYDGIVQDIGCFTSFVRVNQ